MNLSYNNGVNKIVKKWLEISDYDFETAIDLGTLVNREKASILIYKTEEFLKWIRKKIN